MSNFLPAATMALTLLLVPFAAAAEPGNANGNGRGLVILGQDGTFCPPGLARRDPACVPPGQARRALTEAERAERREQRRAERRAEAERETEAERIAGARAECRAARREAEQLAAARAEAEREAQPRAEALAEGDGRSGDDASRAARILTSLLTSPTQVSASSNVPHALPLQQATTLAPAPVAQQPMTLTEALARAAATGTIGY